MTVSDEHGSLLVKILDIVNTIATLAIGGLAMGGLTAATTLQNLSRNLSSHIFLVTFGYILIISQAVVSMNPSAGWARAFRYQHKKTIHLRMQLVGAMLAIIGAILGMRSRNSFGVPRSNHGIMGITTLALLIVSLLGGLTHAFANNKLIPANITKMGHKLIGCVTILFAFVTFMLGLEKLYSNEVLALLISFGVISILGILIPPITHMLRRTN